MGAWWAASGCGLALWIGAAALGLWVAPPIAADDGPGAEPYAPKYGFRVDPMPFAREDATVQGAKIRTFVLNQPKPGDADVLEKAILEVLASQQADGSWPRNQTASRLYDLAELGAKSDRPEIRRAIDWLLRMPDADRRKALRVYYTSALLRMGRTDVPGMGEALRDCVAHPGEWMAKGCPWGMGMTLEILWSGRDLVDTRATVERGLRWMVDGLNAAGCLSYWDPWGFVGILGTIDHPQAGEALRKQVGMLLRTQRPDGGWGDNSFRALRALKLHGLLEPLRAAPPLPPDWEVVRSIPAPKGALWTLTWDGTNLWVKDGDTDSAVAVDPRDGTVVHTVRLPAGRTEGLGLWDGQLAAIQSDPKRVLKLDKRTGEVLREIPIGFAAWPGCGIAQLSGMLWVTDGYLFPGWVVDPENPTPQAPPGATDDMVWRARLEPHLAGPLPLHIAPTPDGVWQTDYWSQLLLESGRGGVLVDWGEKPFGAATAGIAWDGESLWALDGAQSRICVVRKSNR